MSGDVWIQLGEFVLSAVALGAAGIWRISRLETDITTRFDRSVTTYREEIQSDMIDLREKQGEIERWVLEQFVRREDMKAAIDQINISLSDIRQRLDMRMDRMENKIDSLNNHK